MRILNLALLALVLAAAPVSAQTHPCDSAPVGGVTVASTLPVTVGVCWAPKDADGNPTTLTGMRITVNGVQVFSGIVTPIGSPNAAGLNYYETKITVTKGNSLNVVAYAVNVEGETASDPFVFTLKGVPPGKPTVDIVKK